MTTIDTASSLLSEADHRAQLHRAVIASTVGTTIEWYDFFLYGQVTGLVFGKLLFPKSDPLVGVLQAFAIYAVGFVARPVGAAIFGHYGDRIGCKAALAKMGEMAPAYVYSVFVLTYGTTVLGSSRDLLLSALVAAAAMSFLTVPIAGYLSDRIGRKRMYLIGSVATALLAAFGSGYVIAAYILFCAIVSVVATVLLPDYTNRDISEEYA
jgi:MFS family permease